VDHAVCAVLRSGLAAAGSGYCSPRFAHPHNRHQLVVAPDFRNLTHQQDT